jgi:hypothetical protein
MGVNEQLVVVAQPASQLGAPFTQNKPSVVEAPQEVAGAALPVAAQAAMSAGEHSAVARGTVLEKAEAQQPAVRLPRQMNRKRASLAVQRVHADPDFAKRRLAAALSERLMVEAPSEPTGRAPAGHRAQVFDPLERRN